MAKDLKTDFNAQEFLDTFGAEAAATPVKPKEKATKEPAPPEPPPEPKVSAKQKDALARVPVNPDRTPQENEYLQTFVESCPIGAFNKKGRQVMVVNEHRQKILKILALFGEDGTIAGYVYNVLERHFADFDNVIQSLYRKSKQI